VCDVLPKGLSSEDVIRAFVRAGGMVRDGKGSHVNIKMPNGQLVTIPNHASVKTGLLQSAIKKAGLTVDKFIAFL
jgi:predicted RNA binding protein YcfA (HicA-like mRNA interferase family)